MTAHDCDMAIVGGGLAGGLIALAVAHRRPDLTVRLFEAGPTVGGNHRWSWFAADLSPAGERLMAPLSAIRWDNGYTVNFPARRRTLATPYRSLASRDFAADLARQLPRGTIRTNCRVADFDAHAVTLAGGERITARAVLDCRAFTPSVHLSGGWQAFVGHHLRTDRAHGVERPMIMDASVPQGDAFRFVYVLPLGARELLIEDTCYQTSSSCDDDAFARRIARYAAEKGWTCERLGMERGMLPVVTGGNFEAWQAERRIEGVARAGAHAGFLHPLTGYTLPFAVETALAVADNAGLPGPDLAALLERLARDHWRATRFYRHLGSMLLGAARPDGRWHVFDRFYRLSRPLIERFYAARGTRLDRLRVLCGKPPVPPIRALHALASSRPRLRNAA